MFNYSLVVSARREAKKAIKTGLCENFYKALNRAELAAEVEGDKRALRQLSACEQAVRSGDSARIYIEPVSSERQKTTLAALAAKAKPVRKDGTVVAD